MPRRRPSGGFRTASAKRSAARLIARLEEVRRKLLDAEAKVPLASYGRSRESARNFVHYLALRQFDLRAEQSELADLGLSSLGRAESHVLHNLEAVLARLYALADRPPPERTSPAPIDPGAARRQIDINARRLFGPAPAGRDTRIMVTAPVEFGRDPALARDLLAGGTDCLRINCAHDTRQDWESMLEQLRHAQGLVGRICRVEMDLGGPRLRTGPLEPGPAVLKIRPQRDRLGKVSEPAKVALVAAETRGRSEGAEGPEIPVPGSWLRRRRRGERVRLRDARGALRELRILLPVGDGWSATLANTAYITNGVRLEGHPNGARPDPATVVGIESQPGRIRLTAGMHLLLSASSHPGHDRREEGQGRSTWPTIGVTLPAVVVRLRPGQSVWFDGGRFGGTVRSVSEGGAVVRIDQAPTGGSWLRGDQGVNLPETDLGLPPLTEEDRANLPFIVRHADLVGYSFVQSARDVFRLREELARLGRPSMGVVLKIETRRAFERLPEILLAAIRSGPAAVMLARGDLAVEVGFERLAEVQEEILWLSEAAHLPTVWATQVLEGLAKSGTPSRAEVTDAAMGERAECVMLNKGPYMVTAVRALDSIVRRMQAHQAKKSARLRHLAVAERFLTGDSGRRLGDRRRPSNA